jgi:hypothetical protein
VAKKANRRLDHGKALIFEAILFIGGKIAIEAV